MKAIKEVVLLSCITLMLSACGTGTSSSNASEGSAYLQKHYNLNIKSTTKAQSNVKKTTNTLVLDWQVIKN